MLDTTIETVTEIEKQVPVAGEADVLVAGAGPAGMVAALAAARAGAGVCLLEGMFIDTTGDGDLAARAGCGYDLGKDESGACQPMTFMALVTAEDLNALGPHICFWDGGEPKKHKTVNYRAVESFYSEIRRAGIEPSYQQTKLFQIQGNLMSLMVNHEYGASAINAEDITRASVSGRAEIHRIVKGLKSLGGPWAGLQLVATCEQIGVREGRRIHGHYTVSAEDLAVGRQHEDAVCTVYFGVDIHSTDGKKSTSQDEAAHKATMRPYQIPMRALIAKDVDNLLLGGRCLSGDFIAHSSYRVTGTAAATGQASGIAAALAAQTHTAPASIEWPEIREQLQMLTQSE